jgi:hypothetical protein
MSSTTHTNRPLAELPLSAGPLCYQLCARDAWGESLLAQLDAHIAPPSRTTGTVDRVFHLHRLEQSNEPVPGELPQPLSTYLEKSERPSGWKTHDNLLNALWHSSDSHHSFWTAGADPELGWFRFHLPWDLLISDMVKQGGGLIHGGLAIHRGEAALFLAPPGGGKTTTLASAAPGWQVLADDSALIWPASDGSWQASPMPTWSSLIGQTVPISTDRLTTGEHYPLKAVISLIKAETPRLAPLEPIAAAPLIYRSLNEYTATVLADPLHRKEFFATACHLARTRPCWRLELPLGADIWPLLECRFQECVT